MRPLPFLALSLFALAGVMTSLPAQQTAGFETESEARQALLEARQQGLAARRRAEMLERQVAEAGVAADRTAQQAAAAAARIQEAQAEVAARRADIAIIDRQRQFLRAQLARRQQPVMRLTAALEQLSRRPLIFTLLRPGSLRDTVHMRAMLDTMLPEVRRRTASLRVEIARSRALKERAQQALAGLKTEQTELGRRRQSLIALETRQRLELRTTSGSADREAERALALAEQARDLDALTAELGRAGELRGQLMALPGPVPRPANPAEARMTAPEAAAPAPAARAPAFALPVQGRLVAGFGETRRGAPASRGIGLAASGGAQAVAPAEGRVVFAGPYRGFGAIVIVDHGSGWTSLVTGLAQLEVRVGDRLVAGSPIGTAGPGRPVVSFELRRNGEAVNPLDHLRLP